MWHKHTTVSLLPIAHLKSLMEPLKKKFHVDVFHKADDNLNILLYFTFTLLNKSLETGTTLQQYIYFLIINKTF